MTAAQDRADNLNKPKPRKSSKTSQLNQSSSLPPMSEFPPLPKAQSVTDLPFDQSKAQPSLEDFADRPSTYNPKGLEKKYNEFFTYSFGPIIVLLLWWITQDLEKAAFYAPNPEECIGIAPHAARVVDRFSKWAHVPEEIHEFIITSDDSLALGYVVTGYLHRIGVLEQLGPTFFGLFQRGKHVTEPEKVFNEHTKPIPTPIFGNTKPSSNGNSPIPVTSIPGLGDQWKS